MPMQDKFLKFALALKNNKFLKREGLFIVSYSIPYEAFYIWYLDGFIPKVFDICYDKYSLKFKWEILMKKKGL